MVVNDVLCGPTQNRFVIARYRLRTAVDDDVIVGQNLVAVLYEVVSSDAGLKDIRENSGSAPL